MEVELSHADVEGSWTRDGLRLQPGPTCQLAVRGPTHTLTLLALRPQDGGLIAFKAEGVHTSARLVVTGAWAGRDPLQNAIAPVPKTAQGSRCRQGCGVLEPADPCFSPPAPASPELPVRFSRPLQDVVATEKDKVTLECELSRPNVDVRWLKDGVELRVCKTVGITAQGACRSLIIYRCELGDQGVYVCDAHDAQSSASLKVQASWGAGRRAAALCVRVWQGLLAAPGRNVQIVRPLEDVEVMEKEGATFSCEVSLDEVPAQWFWEGSKLRPSDNVRIRQEGRTYTLVYRRVLSEDAGEIKFVAENAESRAQLRVKGSAECRPSPDLAAPTELPVTILRPLRDKIAMEKHRGVLECQVSRASAQVQWFKGSAELRPGPKYEMVSDGLYRKLVISEVQPEDEDTYTCDAGDVKTSAQFFVEGARRAGGQRSPVPREELRPLPFALALGNGHWGGCEHASRGQGLFPGGKASLQGRGRPSHWTTGDAPSPTEQSITIVRGLQDVTVMEPAPAWFECEISIPSVRPPKWLLGKTVLHAGADVGVEQEGTVHRLTLRRTCSTMTGPVHFTIGKSRSTARLVVSARRAAADGEARGGGSGVRAPRSGRLAAALPSSRLRRPPDIPVVLTRPLEPKAGRELQSVVLSCDFKPPPKAVQWYREDTPLAPSDKFKMRLAGHMAELRVLRLTPADAGVYRCQAGSAQSSAEVTVEGTERGAQGHREGLSGRRPWRAC
ncbi:hypothetical protein HPG69_008129 [Diceros bicornis minor]|uniref:non-specific serine/threonine protein kinase n=1 Tax=Diceros bicornis minor TaxID=77932 RepID=A0A7J7F7W5_DICBM|nr:hypothetical protein HPG69_008129 [Diceros bicornis minor]